MSDFQPAWDVTSSSPSLPLDSSLSLGLGLAVILVGILGFVFHKNLVSKFEHIKRSALVLVFIGIVWTILHAGLLLETSSEQKQLAEIYQSNDYNVVEGVIEVLHEQPEAGHDKGDIIQIGEQQFELNYFSTTAAYRTTIARGGLLQAGKKVRIGFVEGKIISIAIAN